jgi:phospho-N-acetylmuramoyl-pentapeptide-transferase
MLLYLFSELARHARVFNVFRYITFRVVLAALTALLIGFWLGPWLIRVLTEKKVGQTIRTDGPKTHLGKSGTPTMGGTLILFAIVIPTLLWTDLANPYVWIVLGVTIGLGVLGFIDDYRKLILRNSKGVSARGKLVVQFAVGLIASSAIYLVAKDHQISFPLFKNFRPDLGWFYIPFGTLVIVGASNAVNLTDGLDGLAIGPVMTSAATFVLLAYVSSHHRIAGYLQIKFVPGAGDVAIFCAAMAGAGLAFLWFNTYPAQVFMGDVGALSLGGALGTVAVVTKNEIVLAIAGGIFVLEAVSVIVQVLSFKWTGRRVFKMAPIHHHYELKGWPEPKVIVRFWIISIILALVAVSTLKLR